MMLNELMKCYLGELKEYGYAEGTIRYRQIYLGQFLKFINHQKENEITRTIVLMYQEKLKRSYYTILTICSKLSTLCCFLKWLYKNSYCLINLSKLIEFPWKRGIIPQNILSQEEVRYFLSLPDITTLKGIRDKTILELLYSSGIRRSELAGLNLQDLNVYEQNVRVLGKGQKERIIPVGDIAIFWLIKYIQQARSCQSGTEPALFLDMIQNKRISGSTVGWMVHEYAERSKLNKKITPHTFRHCFATHLLQNGANIRYIQDMLGHASPSTTQLYTKLVLNDIRNVYNKTHPRAKKN
jgi:integrase/recombinase XerD